MASTTGEEVDFVVETSGQLIFIEVKSTDSPRLRDTTHLRSFPAEYGEKARAGLLLHTGTSAKWLTANLLAVPWWMVV